MSRRPLPRRRAQLPPELPTPPTYQKVNPADQPVLYLALTSDTLPLSTVDEYGQTLMAQRISMVNGVAQVQVFGSQKYAVRIQLDPKGLASRGLGINEVGDAVKNANVNIPTGTLYGAHQAFTVQATGQLITAPQYRPLIVAYRGGKPVRLEELGRVLDSVENDKIASWYKNSRAIVLAIQRQPGTNTIEVVDAIKKIIAHPAPTDPGLGEHRHPVRPFRHHPGIGERRPVHPAAGPGTGGPGDLPLPAQPVGHRHPQSGPAHVHRGHLLRSCISWATAWTTSP